MARQLFALRGFYSPQNENGEGGTMNMYETLSLMIAFGILVATIMSK